MILSCVFLFLVLAASSAFIYYLYAFFIPALKLKKRDYNESLASNFNLEDDDFSDSGYTLFSQKEKADDAVFDSIYRSKVSDEKICVEFPLDSNSDEEKSNLPEENPKNSLLDESDVNVEDFSSDKEIFSSEKKSDEDIKCFKFWIYCYKLLHRKEFALEPRLKNESKE